MTSARVDLVRPNHPARARRRENLQLRERPREQRDTAGRLRRQLQAARRRHVERSAVRDDGRDGWRTERGIDRPEPRGRVRCVDEDGSPQESVIETPAVPPDQREHMRLAWPPDPGDQSRSLMCCRWRRGASRQVDQDAERRRPRPRPLASQPLVNRSGPEWDREGLDRVPPLHRLMGREPLSERLDHI